MLNPFFVFMGKQKGLFSPFEGAVQLGQGEVVFQIQFTFVLSIKNNTFYFCPKVVTFVKKK